MTRVRLRPVERQDLAMVVARWQDPEQLGPFAWSGFRSPAVLRRQYEADGFLGQERGMLVVEADGEAAGTVGWRGVDHGPPPASRCWNIGISLLPEHRGHGVGSHAQRLLVDYLFATTTVHRVEAGTDAEHIAEQRALENAGFQRDGVLRGAQFRAGRWHDVAVYSRLRTDPARC